MQKLQLLLQQPVIKLPSDTDFFILFQTSGSRPPPCALSLHPHSKKRKTVYALRNHHPNHERISGWNKVAELLDIESFV